MELLPCPFCGEAPETSIVFEKANISCRNKKCLIMPSTWLKSSNTNTKKVIKAWNTRNSKEGEG